LENATYEVVADEGVDVAVDMEKGTVDIQVDNGTVTEFRAVILFFSGKKTLTAVFKFYMGGWDGVTVSEVHANAEGVYEIVTPANLAWVAEVVNSGTESFEGKKLRLMNHIDLGGYEWIPIGTLEYPFKGTLDGNGKTISNISTGSLIARSFRSRAETTTSGTGLFGVTENATFQNVNIANATVNSESNGAAGVLVGVATGTTTVEGVNIENASATASGSESAAGLVVGKATGDIIVSDVDLLCGCILSRSNYLIDLFSKDLTLLL
jgi:hypothetical protein